MGHSSKKKKRAGPGRRRPPSDHTSIDGVGSESLSDELTAVCSILQEDCDVVSESPPQIKIKLRPYTQDSGYEDVDVSAFLSIRFLPGYPYKCPKLTIIPEKGLSKADADNLLSLLHDQANLNAREGRVMIYNLVEAAQEFLSEVVTIDQPLLSRKNATVCDRPSKGPFIYGFLDLFIGSGESWHWGLSVEESNSTIVALDNLNGGQPSWEKVNQTMKMGVVEGGQLKVKSTERLDILEEDDSKSTDSLASQSAEPVENVSVGEDYLLAEDTEEETDYDETESDILESASSVGHHQISHTVERDLILMYLRKDNTLGSLTEGTLLAVGGRYDYLLHRMWQSEYSKMPSPSLRFCQFCDFHSKEQLGPVLLYKPLSSILLLIFTDPLEMIRAEVFLFVQEGGGFTRKTDGASYRIEGGRYQEFVPTLDPSLTEQYEYANEHDIKCLVIISDTGVSQNGSVKIRHLELKKEKEVSRELLTNFFIRRNGISV